MLSHLSKTTTIILSSAILASYFEVQLSSRLGYAVIALLLLNWKNLPTVWHWKTFSPLRSHLYRRWRSRMGLYRPTHAERARELGFPKEDWHLRPIGISPFDQAATVTTWYYAGIADADFNLHLSNSVYAKDLDHARVELNLQIFGELIWIKGFNALLGGISFIFLKEIHVTSRYQVETIIVAWDDRWFYVLHRFTLPINRRKGRDTVIKTTTGDRVLCTLAMSKVTCKVGRELAVPSRVLAYCGFGRDGKNWSRTKAIQKKGAQAQKALLKGEVEVDPHLEAYQERNKKALAIINELGGHENKAVWLELARMHE